LSQVSWHSRVTMTLLPTNEGPPCILVAESDEALRTEMCRALREVGYRVHDAITPRQALRCLAARPVDVLITAIMMSDGDGYELITAAKREHAARRILAISGRGVLGDFDLLRIADLIGADATLAKPFAIDQLLTRVAELVDRPPTCPLH
jgi:DNA-binding response OmpR family regulator